MTAWAVAQRGSLPTLVSACFSKSPMPISRASLFMVLCAAFIEDKGLGTWNGECKAYKAKNIDFLAFYEKTASPWHGDVW